MSEMESRPPVWMLDAEKIGTAVRSLPKGRWEVGS